MNKLIRNGVWSLLLVTLAPAAQADVYRWVDAQGQVHFEDRSQSQSAHGMRSYTPPAAAADNSKQRQEKTRKLLNAYQAERQQARERQEKQKQAQEKRRRNCAVAKDNLRQYQSYGSIYRLDEAGERVYLDEQETEALLKKSRDAVAKWCG